MHLMLYGYVIFNNVLKNECSFDGNTESWDMRAIHRHDTNMPEMQ